MNDRIIDTNACPACGAKAGELCDTVIDGEQTHWTHDARFFAAVGWRSVR